MNKNSFCLNPTKLTYLKQATLDRFLGSGTFSDVMLFKTNSCVDACGSVVVKRMKMQDKLFFNKEEFRKHYDNMIHVLYNEYEIGCKLIHQNIIKTLDIDETNGCIILENFVGTDLLDLLNESDTPKRQQLIGYFFQIIDGVEYMHNMGVAHMDLKLENIVLNKESGIVKVIDFGYAMEFMNDLGYVRSNKICGTECYFPPEFFTNLRYSPEKVDVWCCGIILYNLIYDKMPWEFACAQRDTTYNIYKNKCKREMPNVLFPDVKVYGFNESDAEVIYKLFAGMLDINSNTRLDIGGVKKLIQEMSERMK